jgi:hypothetical protein
MVTVQGYKRSESGRDRSVSYKRDFSAIKGTLLREQSPNKTGRRGSYKKQRSKSVGKSDSWVTKIDIGDENCQ